MIYKCKRCGETFPYEPVFCNDCGTRFGLDTFEIVKPLKDSWTRDEVVALINNYEKDTFPSRYDGYPTEQSEIDNWIKSNL